MARDYKKIVAWQHFRATAWTDEISKKRDRNHRSSHGTYPEWNHR